MHKLLSILFLLTVMVSTGQAQVKNSSYNLMLKTLLSHTVTEVTVEEVKNQKDVVFLDAREKPEFEVSHIEGAVWIGYDDFEDSRVESIDKSQKVIVYCSVGYRSEKITEKLLELGFEDVSNLYGGIFEWVNDDNPVVEEESTPTEKVHAYDRIWGTWLDIDRERKVYKR